MDSKKINKDNLKKLNEKDLIYVCYNKYLNFIFILKNGNNFIKYYLDDKSTCDKEALFVAFPIFCKVLSYTDYIGPNKEMKEYYGKYICTYSGICGEAYIDKNFYNLYKDYSNMNIDDLCINIMKNKIKLGD